MKIIDLFKLMMIVQLFYAFAITGISYALPDNSKNYVTSFSDITETLNLEGMSSDIQDSVETQTNIPVIELGALVFYSGNILIDLLLNFAFAIPQMIGMLINGILFLINVDSFIFALVQLFASVVIMVIYFLGLIQLITGIRSGRLV